MNHNITRKTGGHYESSWMQPICSCGWEGKKHYAYDDYQHSEYSKEVKNHVNSEKLLMAMASVKS